MTGKLTEAQLDEPVKLQVVKWEGRIRCAYLNDHRIVGAKPWGGGATLKAWDTSLREIIRAFPELQNALGFDYLGRPIDSPAGRRAIAKEVER